MWILKDVVLVVGGVIMTSVSIVGFIGLGFNIREIHNNIGALNLTWFEFGFILLVISFWVVIIKLIIKINKLRKASQKEEDHVEIEIGRICPHGNSVSLEFTLHVNNVPMQLAKVELVMDNERIPCSHMPTCRILDNIETHEVEFPIDLNKATKHAKYASNQVSWSGILCILAGGQERKSKEFVISSAPIRLISHNEGS